MHKQPTVSELLQQGFSKTFTKRFWRRVNKDGPIPQHRQELGKCWLWDSGRNAAGYGFLRMGADHMPHILAHRASWVLHNGTIPEGKFVLHHCDNPPCCNPRHLFLGGHLENARDKMSKGRAVNLKAEEHGMAKLTWEQVRAIRATYSTGQSSYRKLAKQYGMAISVIGGILKGHNWKEPMERAAIQQ